MYGLYKTVPIPRNARTIYRYASAMETTFQKLHKILDLPAMFDTLKAKDVDDKIEKRPHLGL